jgi:hypothetical protein
MSFPVFTFVYDYARLYNFICGLFTTLKFVFRKGIVKPVSVFFSWITKDGTAKLPVMLFNFALPKT